MTFSEEGIDEGGQIDDGFPTENESHLTMVPSTQQFFPENDVENASISGSDVSDVEVERGNWTGRFDFLLSLLGYSVGLGNVWRFPYLCYQNGGGAFLVPFVVMLIVAGLPLMFMELSFGQYVSRGPVVIFEKFLPLFKGLGFGMVVVSGVVCLYYNMIIAWSIYYLFVSFRSQLPWETCDPSWATKDCYSFKEADECLGVFYDGICYSSENATRFNITHELVNDTMHRKAPAEEYFNNHVLSLSKGIGEIGQVQWQLLVSLLAAWIIVFACLSKGVQTSGKVVYFTALFPYLVLFILFFRGVTLPGALDGIIWYVTPNFSKLGDAKVWQDAAVQIFFALSPAWGGLITLASYNKFHNNCYKDSLIVSVSNVLTSIFAGFVIFSVIGFLAHELEKPVDKVVNQGAGLAFFVYPEVVTRLPISPLWSVLFFLMLITLGLDSQFALLETMTTAIFDRYPKLISKKTWVVLLTCTVGFLFGIVFCAQGGMYVLELMDTYAASWCVMLMAFLECILIAWVYGADRFLRDIESMIGPYRRLWHYTWMFMWKFLTPSALIFILVFSWIKYKPISSEVYVYPFWANLIGWFLAVAPIIAIPIFAIEQIQKCNEATFFKKIIKLLKPSAEWKPSHKQCHTCRKHWGEADIEEGKAMTNMSSKNFLNPGFNRIPTSDSMTEFNGGYFLNKE